MILDNRGAVHPDDLWYSEMDDEDRHVLEGCIVPFVDALPDDMHRLPRRIDLDGLSQKDYAEDIGVSYSTLTSRVQKRRSPLRQRLERCCDLSMGPGQYHRLQEQDDPMRRLRDAV